MAELPAELIHIILANITDYRSLINMALTSRLYYTAAMPVILSAESRYVRNVMIPLSHLSIYEFPDSRSRPPPAGLGAPADPFTGTIRMISFISWPDSMYLCCIRRLVQRAKHLEHITMNLMEGSNLSWLTAYINICVGHRGVTFTLNGGKGHIAITDSHRVYSSDTPPSPTTQHNGFSRLYQQLKSTATLKHGQSGSQTPSNASELVTPKINGLELINENLFSSPLAHVVHTLTRGEHITSFSFGNERHYNYHTYHIDNHGATTSPMAIFATLSLPSLTRLSITHTVLPIGALTHFLARHQLITDLYLDLLYPFHSDRCISFKSFLINWSVPTSPPKRFLPNLARLGGTTYWVLPFVRWRQLGHQSGGNAGHLPALEEVELRAGPRSGRRIWPTTYMPPHQQPRTTNELIAVYDVLFCVNAAPLSSFVSPWKAFSSKRPNPEARTRIRTLALGKFSYSHFIEWLMLEAAKRQAWPVLSDNAGAGIEKLIVSEGQTFVIALKTRAELLNALGRWCPDLTREIVGDRRARRRHADAAGDAYAGLYAPWPDEGTEVRDAVEEAFTQYLLERVIWHTFPNLQILQIGVDKRDRPPSQYTSVSICRSLRFE